MAQANDLMRCYIKQNGIVSEYVLIADSIDGPWELLPQGVNTRWDESPQAKDHARLLAKIEGIPA